MAGESQGRGGVQTRGRVQSAFHEIIVGNER